jgi:cytochrome c-type biogenesis protein CcmE
MLDDKGVRKEVKLLKAKPQDFERSESVVLIGKVENDTFHAKEILMKCPSKYNEQNQIETTL